MKLLCFDQTE